MGNSGDVLGVEVFINGSDGLDVDYTGWWDGFLLAFVDQNGHA